MRCMLLRVFSALMLGLIFCAPALGDQDDEIDRLRAEMDKLRAEVAELRAQQRGDWLTEARRAEVRGLIEDVLADAQTRSGLLERGLVGVNSKGEPFLMSSDGSFTMNFYALLQLRYYWNSLDTDNAGPGSNRASQSLSGFQVRRLRFGVDGKVGDGWGYTVRLATQSSAGSVTPPGTAPANGLGDGDVVTEDAFITYRVNDEWDLLFGVARMAFARQELISATRQLGVDRGLANEFFTLNRGEMLQARYTGDRLMGTFAVSDGGNAEFSNPFADRSNDFAFTGRLDIKALGEDWKHARDERAGIAGRALYFGAAIHAQDTEGSTAPRLTDSGLAWTVDALYKAGPVALSAAVFGNHTDNEGASDSDQYGLYAQGDVALTDDWSVFGRWEWIDDDGVSAPATDPLQALTVGFGHRVSALVRLTGDVVWVYAGDNPTADGSFINGGELSGGLGLSSSGFSAADNHDDQVAFRVQLQLLF